VAFFANDIDVRNNDPLFELLSDRKFARRQREPKLSPSGSSCHHKHIGSLKLFSPARQSLMFAYKISLSKLNRHFRELAPEIGAFGH
jgi:hypothetical protein